MKDSKRIPDGAPVRAGGVEGTVAALFHQHPVFGSFYVVRVAPRDYRLVDRARLERHNTQRLLVSA